MDLVIKNNVNEVLRELDATSRKQVPFATSLALNNMAWNLAGFRGKKGIMPRLLPKYIDRPRYKNPFAVEKATKRYLLAKVKFKDKGKRVFPARYYYPQVYGGKREAKAFEKALRRMGILGGDEFAVPGKYMKLDRFGNLTGATYSKMLADVNQVWTGGNDIGAGFGQRTTKRGKKKYFYHHNLRPRGIWIRQNKMRAFPAVIFVKGAPSYRRRFPMQEIGEAYVNKHFDREFAKAFAYAQKTAMRA